jgi:hypothetical protein
MKQGSPEAEQLQSTDSLLQNIPQNWCLRCRDSHVRAIIVVEAIIDSIFRSLGHMLSISGRIYSVLGFSGRILNDQDTNLSNWSAKIAITPNIK